MSTAVTITPTTQITGTNDPTKQISKDAYNAGSSVAGGSTGAVLIIDTGQSKGVGSIAAVETGQVLVSGGVGAEPAWSASPTVTGLTVTTITIGAVTLNATEAAFIDGVTAGTGAANKALVLNASGDITAGLRNITLTGGTVTTSTPVLNVTQTLNDAGVSFTVIKANVTDSASASASLLLDLQVGGATKFNITKAGNVVSQGTISATSIFTSSASFLHRTTSALNNGAAAAAGTLTNAPAAGNPTKWIAVDDNGTTRYIPAW